MFKTQLLNRIYHKLHLSSIILTASEFANSWA